MASPADELVEEVDPAGDVVRIVTRREMRAARLRHRAVFVAVVDHRGRLLVHRRAPDKDVWPDRWDVAAGGVLAVGESWSDGARRELAEELGIDAEPAPLGGGAFEDPDAAVVGEVFLARSDGPVRFADGEVVEARWVGAADLADLRRDHRFCPDGLALVLPRVVDLLAP